MEAVRLQLARVLKRLAPLFPDRLYLRLLYFLTMGRVLHLSHPEDFSEKLQWLKLYHRTPRLTMLVDKLAVKEHISQLLGPQYVSKVIAVWDKASDITLDQLPEQFVLKTNHSGGNTGVVICADKRTFDLEEARRKLNESMRSDIYSRYREWPYKDVPRKIFAEEYLGDNLTDYKLYCADGHAECLLLCMDRQKGHVKYYFLDRQWQLLPYNSDSKNAPADLILPHPAEADTMFELADRLSKGFPFVRIDFFETGGRLYFAEYTFYPASGLDAKKTPEFEKIMGGKIVLEIEN